MEEDKAKAGAESGSGKGKNAALDEVKEEATYGEEVVEED